MIPTSPSPPHPTPPVEKGASRMGAIGGHGNLDEVPWTGITVMIAVMSLLLFMAVPMTGPTDAERAEAHIERQAFVAFEELRRAIDDFQGDHGVWPGQTASTLSSFGPAKYDAFSLVQQLELHSDLTGSVLPNRDEDHPFGPYLPNGIPANPLNGRNQVRVVQPGESFHSAYERGYGWLYNPISGELRSLDKQARGNRQAKEL